MNPCGRADHLLAPRACACSRKRYWFTHGTGSRLITTAMAVLISTERERVWRALADSSEVVRWDDSRTALIDRECTYPVIGEQFRWRSKLGGVALVLNETPIEVEPPGRLAVTCSMGSLRYEELFLLAAEADGRAHNERTRVSLKLSTGNRLQLLGTDLDRFELREMLIGRVDRTLRSLQKWCEN